MVVVKSKLYRHDFFPFVDVGFYLFILSHAWICILLFEWFEWFEFESQTLLRIKIMVHCFAFIVERHDDKRETPNDNQRAFHYTYQPPRLGYESM